jgi:uncharacterized membrane protein
MRVDAINPEASTPKLAKQPLCRRVGAEMDFDKVIGYVGQVVDAVGVIAIVLGGLLAIVIAVSRQRRGEPDVYSQFRRLLGRSILLGLELLVAGDIIRTVATQPTLGNIAVLAGIVLIRTFLSFSLELEITGRWPWQSANRGEDREPSRP